MKKVLHIMHDRSIIMRSSGGMAKDEDCQRTFFLLYWKGSGPGGIGPYAGRREAEDLALNAGRREGEVLALNAGRREAEVLASNAEGAMELEFVIVIRKGRING